MGLVLPLVVLGLCSHVALLMSVLCGICVYDDDDGVAGMMCKGASCVVDVYDDDVVVVGVGVVWFWCRYGLVC